MSYKCKSCQKVFSSKKQVIFFYEYGWICVTCSKKMPKESIDKNNESIKLVEDRIAKFSKEKDVNFTEVLGSFIKHYQKTTLDSIDMTKVPECNEMIDDKPMKKIHTYKDVKTGKEHKCRSY